MCHSQHWCRPSYCQALKHFDFKRPPEQTRKQQNEYLFLSISAPWLETNPSGCVQINQIGTDEDGLWGIIHPHATFQIEILEIFQGTLQMIQSNVPLTLSSFFFLQKFQILAIHLKQHPFLFLPDEEVVGMGHPSLRIYSHYKILSSVSFTEF